MACLMAAMASKKPTGSAVKPWSRRILRPSIRRKILLDHGFTALPVGFLDGLLDGRDGLPPGRTPLMAKKHVCMMVLMRLPMPASRATP